MASETQICNLALNHIGAFNITSLAEDSEEANKCNLFFDDARDFVLTEYPWNFAEKRAALSLESSVTPTGYTYAYAYPADCLKARYLYNAASKTEKLEFVVNISDDLTTRYIFTDQADAILVYTAAIEDPTLFDAVFIQALSYKLASDLAMPLTKKRSIMEDMLNLYSAYMAAARANNAQEGYDLQKPTNPFIAARA